MFGGTFVRNQNKYCKSCESRSCPDGLDLQMPCDPLRQQYVCRSCILKGHSCLVKSHIKEGTIEVLQMRRESREGCSTTCGQSCDHAPRGLSHPYPGNNSWMGSR